MALKLVNPPRNYTPPASVAQPSFSLSADPGTDLWRKPPSTNSFSAPILYYELPLASLRSARFSLKSEGRSTIRTVILPSLPKTNGAGDQARRKDDHSADLCDGPRGREKANTRNYVGLRKCQRSCCRRADLLGRDLGCEAGQGHRRSRAPGEGGLLGRDD